MIVEQSTPQSSDEVIQFDHRFVDERLLEWDAELQALDRVRDEMLELSLMFWDENEGLKGIGHGNVALVRRNGLLVVSASQMQREREVGPEGYTEIVACDLTRNQVYVRGVNKASSETLASYEIARRVSRIMDRMEGRETEGLRPGIAVLHPHGKIMHAYGEALGLQQSSGEFEAGTVGFARECGDAVDSSGLDEAIFVTPKHQGEFIVAQNLGRAVQIMIWNLQRGQALVRPYGKANKIRTGF